MSETFTSCAGPFNARVLGRVTDDQEIPIVANAGGCPDAVIAVVGYDCPENRLIGTALLFQAAPDLLAAAERFVNAVDDAGWMSRITSDFINDSSAEFRAAIAKAKGGVS